MFNNIVITLLSSGLFSGLFTLFIQKYLTRKVNHSFDKKLELYKDEIGRELEQYKTELKLIEAKNSSKWEIRRSACLHALDVADSIISQRSWKEILEASITKSGVSTIEARKAYNRLACSCENLDTLEIFRKIMSSTEENMSVDIIVDFRNAVRKELEYERDIDTDRTNAFIFEASWDNSL